MGRRQAELPLSLQLLPGSQLATTRASLRAVGGHPGALRAAQVGMTPAVSARGRGRSGSFRRAVVTRDGEAAPGGRTAVSTQHLLQPTRGLPLVLFTFVHRFGPGRFPAPPACLSQACPGQGEKQAPLQSVFEKEKGPDDERAEDSEDANKNNATFRRKY